LNKPTTQEDARDLAINFIGIRGDWGTIERLARIMSEYASEHGEKRFQEGFRSGYECSETGNSCDWAIRKEEQRKRVANLVRRLRRQIRFIYEDLRYAEQAAKEYSQAAAYLDWLGDVRERE
jgi:hypothetical protein